MSASSMEMKWMRLPRIVIVGPDAIFEIGKVCSDLNLIESCGIVCGKKTRKIAGELVSELLEDIGIHADVVEIDEASMEAVSMVMEEAGKNNWKFLIGAGGGKSIDVAKLSSSKLSIPFISIPTAASHDGIASSRASIKSSSSSTSVEAQPPDAVIADTSIILKAPYRMLASGCGDIISNYTAVLDWQLAHRLRNEYYSEYAASLSLMTAKMIMNSADLIRKGLEDSVRMVVKALVSSGVAMSIAGSSRPASGSEHMFSHALDMIAPRPAMHGEQCGVGAIMMMYLHGGDWEAIRNALRRIGAPTTAEELGIEREYIIEALLMAHKIRPERYTILGSGLTREAAEKLVEVTGVCNG
ncbi:MAG: glycerol-phosphate dehydrogenase [Archaeoglobi archaeon]|nr:glycerol-phosphate dehydrogenase [Archaeoglobi archaeon]MDK2781049.1 glycerol-phosphate dehydrogenase [Archaeoglobi archaeon]